MQQQLLVAWQKTRCSKTACSLFLLLHLSCIFAFKLLRLVFQKIWKIHNSTDQTVCIKQGSYFILMTSFFEQWAACLCSSNLHPIWGKNWPGPIPFQNIATATQCSMVCAEKIKQNKTISATHILVYPLGTCILKILEDAYNCSEDHNSNEIYEAKGKAVLKPQKERDIKITKQWEYSEKHLPFLTSISLHFCQHTQ